MYESSYFAYCFTLVNVISLPVFQSDYIKQHQCLNVITHSINQMITVSKRASHIKYYSYVSNTLLMFAKSDHFGITRNS